MELNMVHRTRILGYLKENAIGDLRYLDLKDSLGNDSRISDIDILIFFVNLIIGELRKNVKISMKQLSKYVFMVDCFLEWAHDDGVEVENIILDKIRSFEEYYDDYLNRNEFDIDLVFTEGVLANLQKTIEKLYPQVTSSESVVQYLERIAELENELRKLKRDYDEVVKRFDDVQSKYEKKVIDCAKKSGDLAQSTQLVESKDRELLKLNETISSLEESISSLEALLGEVRAENTELVSYKVKYGEVLEELEKVKEEIDARDRVDNQAILQRNIDSEVESLIYRKLLVEQANINEILDYLSKEGYSLSKNEVYNLLNRVKSKINVVNGTFSLSPTYKIVAPNVIENGVFDLGIPAGTKRYDILLVSDYHLDDVTNKFIAGTNMAYDYCVGHDINLILNLGDFFEHIDCDNIYDGAVANYRLAEKAISLLPKCDGIYHAVLGGNHDRRVLKYGFDHIDMIAREREDFINLGYRHCTVTMNGSKSVCNSFDLHHPNGMSFDLTLGNDGVDSENILGYLNQLYKRIGRDRNDSFVDLFGHTHKSQFNFMDSYCFIPALFEGKSRKGACHLRIYLDEETQIKYMVFMPLSVTDRFTKQTEIVYEKVLSR